MKQINYGPGWNQNIEVKAKESKEWPRRGGKVILYIGGEPSPEAIYPEEWPAERIKQKWDEVNVKGSKVWKDYNKAELKIMKQAIDVAAPEIEAALKKIYAHTLNENDIRWVYSRKAGCNCGCSPGYIMKRKEGNRYITIKPVKDIRIWVNLATDEQLKKQEEKRAKHEVEQLARKIGVAEEAVKKANAQLEEALKAKLDYMNDNNKRDVTFN